MSMLITQFQIVNVMLLFVYCYFGKLATDSYRKMSDCVYDLNWQELPLRLRKYIILITNMQKTIYYHGFEVAVLNLNTFFRVSHILSFN